jgi:cell division protein ZapE
MDSQPGSSPATGLAAGPLPAYRARVAAGQLKPDPAQELAAETLQDLWRRLRGYDPSPEAPDQGGFLSRFFRKKPVPEAPEGTPQGLYLVGEVGRGKSMLMDLFFACAEVPRKQRIHFHQFMQGCHQRIHRWKQANPGEADPIPPLADSIFAQAALLCFDEFQVHDITDAMILGRLFEALFARGVVVVATSNTAPDDLFKGRPGRDAFLPFIALIKQRLNVLHLEAERDYRRERIRGLPTWHCPVDGRAERALDSAFLELTGQADRARPQRRGDGGGARRGADGFRRAVRPGAGAGGLPGAGNAFPYAGAGWRAAARAGEFRPGAALCNFSGCIIRTSLQAGCVGRSAT